MTRRVAVWLGIAMVLGLPGATPADAPGGRPVQIVGEQAQGGFTTEEYFDRQHRLHSWLTSQLPVGAREARIRVDVSNDERLELRQTARMGPGPLKIGIAKPVSPAVGVRGLDLRGVSRAERPAAGGVMRALEDGSLVWAASVGSDGAGALRVRFTGVDLPEGAELYLISATGEAQGPYLGRGPHDDGDFWTASIRAAEGLVVLRVAPASPEQLEGLSFTVSEIGHIVGQIAASEPQPQEQAICGNPDCIEDASCHNVSAVSTARNAVAKMEWISGAFIFTCTGGLIADTDASTQIPYFLTANHCISGSQAAGNVELFWFYRTSSCNGSCPNDSGFPRTQGSAVMATGSSGDFTLLRLNQTPPAGAQFLGFNNAAVAFTNGADLFRISHPNFGAQVFSQHRVDTGAPTCSGWPRGQRIYSRDIVGATDGGSSGSPVVNAAGQVVGQLSGACGFNVNDPCDAVSNATVDGALAHYWSSVEPFLDPGGGCTPTTEICTGGIDEDCDGAIDCADSNCTGSPSCAGGCATKGQTCTVNSDCCSNKCKGPTGNKTCK